jgi:sirohydrochlorin ferrochelatase
MTPRLVLAAHGSSDPRFAGVVEALAARVRAERPGLDVRIGYLDHGPPHLAEAITGDCVVVPLLLSRGYHALVDVPQQAPGARVTAALGPDPRLAEALADRLREAGYDGRTPVVVAAAGSSNAGARDDVGSVAGALSGRLGVEVTAAFVSTGEPLLADVAPPVVASYLLSPGAFADAVDACGAAVVSRPIGDHPVLARIVLDRYATAPPR